MADEVKVQPEADKPEAESKKSEPAPPRFKITNVVRRVNNRVRRAMAPGRRRFKQFVCGKRLLRKQSIWVSPEEMEKHQAQLLEQVREGAIEITTPDGVVLSADIHGRIVGRRGMEIFLAEDLEKPASTPLKEVETKPERKMEPKVEAPAPTPPPPPAQVEPVQEETPASSKVDNLTELPGVGAGRAR